MKSINIYSGPANRIPDHIWDYFGIEERNGLESPLSSVKVVNQMNDNIHMVDINIEPLRGALAASILSSGFWSEEFDGHAVYPPHFPTGRRILKRIGREDLIPALLARIDTEKYDITSLASAMEVAIYI